MNKLCCIVIIEVSHNTWPHVLPQVPASDCCTGSLQLILLVTGEKGAPSELKLRAYIHVHSVAKFHSCAAIYTVTSYTPANKNILDVQ